MTCVRSDLTRSVFSMILRIYRIGNLHGVTICRELGNSDQVIKFEHGGDRSTAKYTSMPMTSSRFNNVTSTFDPEGDISAPLLGQR